ncbi:MAG: dephospho-CoA kinase [Thiobacillus sp.]|uniref:dephospho-CoA kinase n=1 Tax=Thiobacillus sp. TaxID=924 RepID=UPI002733E096|nr:dephospho-CoA kinase [Thiobacillus sp.]MDP3585935.1 dephospho-CoA kinase [Thiobacillus sp.]
MFTVGLTGGIGSGKSTVADLFAEQGVPVIDTDVIARELTAPDSEVLITIQDAFGDAVMREDGSLDRAQLRRRVFADPAARHMLEAILHPRIRQAVVQALAGLHAPYALIVIPLLVETGAYAEILHRVLVVDCSEDMQITRVMARNDLSRAEVKDILAAQAGRAVRLAAADDVIENTGPPEGLRDRVHALHTQYMMQAAAASP